MMSPLALIIAALQFEIQITLTRFNYWFKKTLHILRSVSLKNMSIIKFNHIKLSETVNIITFQEV